MIRTQIQLEQADFDRLKRAAARRSCSIAAFVRESVKTALRESEGEEGGAAVRAIAGKYRSGRGDLARNHDSYLDHGW